jgi:ABC-type nitrate/sulfonate/bicarbonate transport system substrate-binding protein
MSNDTIWYTRCPVPTAFSIAISLGLLDEEFAPDGVRIQSLHVSRDPAVRQSHFTHTQPNSFRHGGHIPPLWARSEGRDVRLIGLSWSDEYQAVIALPHSGIREAADLRGKRIALPRRTNDPIDFWRASGLRGLRSALATAGLTTRDVELVDLPVTRGYIADARTGTSHAGSLWGSGTMRALMRAEIAALFRGDVDAIFAPGSVGVEATSLLGADVVIDLDGRAERDLRLNNATLLSLTVDGALLDERPEWVARVVARVLEAADWAAATPDTARRIVAREVGSAEDVLDGAYRPNFTAHLTPDLSAANVAALRDQHDFLLEHGFIARPVDIERYIDRRPLEAAHRIVERRRSAAELVTSAS